MTDLLPIETRRRWRMRTYRSAISKLDNLLELREILEQAKAEGQRVKMKIIAEAADDFQVRDDTVYADLAIIRRYEAADLKEWIRNGVGFAHIETANRLQEKAKKPAKQLIQEAYQLGNKNGKTMTVRELEAFALGENVPPPSHDKINWVLKSLGNFPSLLEWDERKRVRWDEIMDEIREMTL